jgi:predicted RNase H-like HicB family nuclease
MHFNIEIEQEEDRRWIAEVVDLPGVLTYGQTKEEAFSASRNCVATAKVKALALSVLADRLEHGEAIPESI